MFKVKPDPLIPEGLGNYDCRLFAGFSLLIFPFSFLISSGIGQGCPYADLHGDKRRFLGAVAGVVMTSNVKKYALKQGFYVIEPSGETFNITPPSCKAKEW